MGETSKATISGILDIASGVMGLIGGCVLMMLGLIGGGILGATMSDDLERLALIPLALFLPLAVLNLLAGAFAVAGGLAALRRGTWWLAVVGSIGALICFFPLGVPAMILTVMAESEFRPSQTPQPH